MTSGTNIREEGAAAYRYIGDLPANGSIESAPLSCWRFLHGAGLLEWHCISLCSLPFALASQPTLRKMLQVQARGGAGRSVLLLLKDLC